MAAPVVFADANVLYSSALRDLLMQLALNGVVSLRWSEGAPRRGVPSSGRTGR